MIRSARPFEAEILTKISIESKAYWNYPKRYFNIWKNELIISLDYINSNDIFIFEDNHAIKGYYSIVEVKKDVELSGIKIKKGFWLEHMFIRPQYIGQGIGSKLFNHLLKRCIERGINELNILADPNAKGFYQKMGCQYQGEYPSTIKGRTTPFLVLKIN